MIVRAQQPGNGNYLPAGVVDDSGPAAQGPAVPGRPLTVGSGVQVHAPEGWSVVKSQDGLLGLGKGSAVIIVQALPYAGTLEQFEAAYREADLGSSGAGSDPQQDTFGRGIPSLVVVYSIVSSDSGPVDGEYVVGLQDGIGIIVDLVTPPGSRGRYADDAGVLLASVSINGGGR